MDPSPTIGDHVTYSTEKTLEFPMPDLPTEDKMDSLRLLYIIGPAVIVLLLIVVAIVSVKLRLQKSNTNTPAPSPPRPVMEVSTVRINVTPLPTYQEVMDNLHLYRRTDTPTRGNDSELPTYEEAQGLGQNEQPQDEESRPALGSRVLVGVINLGATYEEDDAAAVETRETNRPWRSQESADETQQGSSQRNRPTAESNQRSRGGRSSRHIERSRTHQSQISQQTIRSVQASPNDRVHSPWILRASSRHQQAIGPWMSPVLQRSLPRTVRPRDQTPYGLFAVRRQVVDNGTYIVV